MPFADVWDVATPPAAEALSLGDDRIREMKRALDQRLSSFLSDWPDGPFGLTPATVAASTSITAPTATLTGTTRQLRLAYDLTHYTDFLVDIDGGISVTPMTGKVFTVPLFSATEKAVLAKQTRVRQLLRTESVVTPDTSALAGAGVEMSYDTTNFGVIKSYDYTAVARKPLRVEATTLVLDATVSANSLAVVGAAAINNKTPITSISPPTGPSSGGGLDTLEPDAYATLDSLRSRAIAFGWYT